MLRKSASRRHRSTVTAPVPEFLETRLLLSNVPAGFSLQEDKEEDQADTPQQVAGAFLTDIRYGDTRPMAFNDVAQGAQDSCVFASTLSGTALSSYDLEGGIREISRSGSTITYGVRLYQNNSGTLNSFEQQVVYDGTLLETDYIPRDDKDYWPLIYQRAYIDYANSISANYKDSLFAFQTLIGSSAARATLANSLAGAQAIRSALTSGQATLAATKSATNLVLENTYGLIKSHAYTVLGVSIPSSGSLSSTTVTVRNPWGDDTSWTFFDADHNDRLSIEENKRYRKGIDGASDGIIKLPWSVFATNFISWSHTNRTGPSINNIVRVDLPVEFTNPEPPSYEIFQGQRLEVPIKAIDPEGRFVFYDMVSSEGQIHPQTGVFSWEPPASTTATHYITISAGTNPGDAQHLTFVVNVISGKPLVTKFTATPTTIKDDGSDLLTLSAAATTPIGRINDIQYWRDADGDGLFDKRKDVLLGESGKFYLGNLTPGQQTIFAQARRFSYTDEFFSEPKAITVKVVAAPKVPAIAIARGNQTQLLNESSSKVVAGLFGESYVLSGRTVRTLDANGQIIATSTVAEAGATNIDITFSPQGDLITVWMMGTTLKAKRGLGTSYFTQTITTGLTLNDHALRVAADYAGQLILVWHRGEYLQEDIWSMSVDLVSVNQATIVRSPWRVNSFTTGSQKYPTIAMDTAGRGVIAWTDFAQGKTIARRITEYGKSNGPEITVANSGLADKLIASAANDDNGDVYVAWTQSDGLYFRRILLDGRMPQAAIKASTFPGGEFFNPDIKVNRDGWVVVGWINTTQDANANDFGGVFAQVFTPGGVKAGPEFPVPTIRNGTQSLTGLTLERNGKLLFVWSNGDFSTSSYNTCTRLFDVDFPPFILPGQTFAVPRNTPAGTNIGRVVAGDANNTQSLAYELLDAQGFAISSTGDITATAPVTFATGSIYALRVRVTSNGKSVEQIVTISLANVVTNQSLEIVAPTNLQLETGFAQSIAADGNYRVVGAPKTDYQGGQFAGRVFVYDDTTGDLIRTIDHPKDDNSNLFFGTTVAISGNLLVVGNGYGPNALYVFDVTTGAHVRTIVSNSSVSSVAIFGQRILVGSTDGNGAGYLYDAVSGTLLKTISSPVDSQFTGFGTSVSINADYLAIGARAATQEGVSAGLVYLFDATSGNLVRTIANPSPANGEYFGAAIAISGNKILVGAPLSEVLISGSTRRCGEAYVIDLASGTLITTLINPDPDYDSDEFGTSVALRGNVAAVGDWRDSNVHGKAFVFDATTGALTAELQNPAADQQAWFGFSLAITSSRIMVGAPSYSEHGWDTETGVVYFCDPSTGAVKRTIHNTTPASLDEFGKDVAVSETVMVVGAPNVDSEKPDVGRVSVFSTSTGALLHSLECPAPTDGSRFGYSVAVNNEVIAVSAPGIYDVASGSGLVYIFSTATGTLIRTIHNPAPAAGDFFGSSLAISDDLLVVGAAFDDAGAVNSGSVYAFDLSTGALRQTLSNPTPAADDNFGHSVAVGEGFIAAGSPNDDTAASNSGAIYAFSSLSGLLIRSWLGPSGGQNDYFGTSVAASGTRIAAGAPNDKTQGSSTGQAYLFEINQPVPVRQISNPTPAQSENFGSDVAISGNVLVVGAMLANGPGGESSAGEAYIYDVRTTTLSTTLKNPTPNSGDFFGNAVATNGIFISVGARLDDTQNTDQGAAYLYELSSAPQDLEISTSYIPENNPANAVVGTLTTYSQSLNPVPYSYELVAGTGDTDNAKFLITANQLILKSTADFEQQRAYNILVRSTDERGRPLDKKLTINVVNQLEGTSAADQFVLTISTTSVSLTLAQNGGVPTNQGTYSLTPQLLQEGFQGVGLAADDTVRIVGSISNDIVAISSSGIVVNGLSIAPGINPKIVVDGSGGIDTYQIDGSATIASLSLFDLSGIDTIDFSSSTKGISLDLSRTTAQAVTPELSITLQPNAFENLYGGTGDDVLTGNSVSNTIKGNNGNDILNGKGGSDTLAGGTGDDTYQMLTASSLETDELIEGLNAGGDTIDFSAITTSVTASLAVKTAQSVHTNRKVTLNADSTFENIVGGSANDTLTGNAQNNRITGGGGSDTQSGVAGNDTYVMTPATLPETDSLSELINAGTDTIDFGLITSNLIVNLGTSLAQQTETKRSIRLNLNNTFENLNGGAGKDLLTGNASANVINGNGGNDTLNGAAGNDLIAGGPGNDVYLMTAATTAETDTLTEAANAGIDSLDFSAITTSVTLNLSSSSSQSVHTNRTLKLNLENTFENAAGGTANDSLTGNNEANVLIGNGGNDSLNGADGNDILIGGIGGDTLNGAAGEDILLAGTTSYDSLFVQLNSLRAVWTGSASYTSRVASLRTGTGAPVVSLKTGTTVFSDALSVDTLVGGTESDWFLAALNDLFTNRTIIEELDLL